MLKLAAFMLFIDRLCLRVISCHGYKKGVEGMLTVIIMCWDASKFTTAPSRPTVCMHLCTVVMDTKMGGKNDGCMLSLRHE